MALCAAAGGLCWLPVYADAIRMGFRQRNGSIPLFALGMNVAWAGLYACMEGFVRSNAGARAAGGGWLLLDMLLAITWFVLSRREAPANMGRRWFVLWSALALSCCLVMQALYMAGPGAAGGENLSACLQGAFRAGPGVWMESFVRRDAGAQAVAHGAELLTYILVVITWYRLGWRGVSGTTGRIWFAAWSVLALCCCLLMQTLLVSGLGGAQKEQYAAYLQCIAISVAYLYMLSRRRTRGQTLLIAACKGAVTLTFIVCGAIGGSGRMAATGAACMVLDAVSMVCLHTAGQWENAC